MKKKYLIIIAALCAHNLLTAQNATLTMGDKSGVNTVCYGDLNKDGVKDKVVVETPQNKKNMKVRDDGYVYNFNQPVLSIYFGSSNGYKLYKTYKNVIPRVESEDEAIDYDISVTDQGALRIAFSVMRTMGSYGAYDYDYIYRYQKGDFYLIGDDYTSMMRNTGVSKTVSNNYVTHKKQVLSSHLEGDKTVKDKENWSTIPAKSLQRLGARNLKE